MGGLILLADDLGGGGGCDPFPPNKPDLGLSWSLSPFAKMGGALGSCLVPTKGVDREKAAKADTSATGTNRLLPNCLSRTQLCSREQSLLLLTAVTAVPAQPRGPQVRLDPGNAVFLELPSQGARTAWLQAASHQYQLGAWGASL